MDFKVVVYTTNQGWLEFRKVPHNLHPADYYKGLLVGPPDLTSLGLSEEDTLALNNALVGAGYADYKSLAGRRLNLLRLVESTLGISEEEAVKIRLQIIGLYQKDYYLVNEV